MKKKKKDSAKVPVLSGLELEVMNVVWDLGDCTSSQVIDRFGEIRPLAPTTIRTVLAKLRTKGYLAQIPSLERGFTFRPVVPREKVARRSLKELVTSLFDGSPRQAISYLLEEKISDEEMEEIRKLIASNDAFKKGKEGAKRRK